MTMRELGWPTLTALLAALAMAVVAATSPEGDLTFTFYKIWWLPVLGLAVTIFAVWRSRRWWLLSLLLVFLAPLVPLLALLTSCAFGDCI